MRLFKRVVVVSSLLGGFWWAAVYFGANPAIDVFAHAFIDLATESHAQLAPGLNDHQRLQFANVAALFGALGGLHLTLEGPAQRRIAANARPRPLVARRHR